MDILDRFILDLISHSPLPLSITEIANYVQDSYPDLTSLNVMLVLLKWEQRGFIRQLGDFDKWVSCYNPTENSGLQKSVIN